MSAEEAYREFERVADFHRRCSLYAENSINWKGSDIFIYLHRKYEDLGSSNSAALDLEVCGIYLVSMNALLSRYESVHGTYKWSKLFAKCLLIRNSDRKLQSVSQSVSKLHAHCEDILFEMMLKYDEAPDQEDTLTLPMREWSRVDRNGRLLMEEIAYLSARVDHLNASIATVGSMLLAVISLIVAIRA